eukprot:6760289-Lingulodinium_polyedra.AAC.1
MRRATSDSASTARSHGTSSTRSTNTASAQPGRMPEVGVQHSPSAPSTRMRRGASYAEHTHPTSH